LEDRCLLSAGALDPTFGNGAGYVTTSIPNGNWSHAWIQPNGRILATGEVSNSSTNNWNFAVARYNSDGSLDTSFGSGGVAQASLGSQSAFDLGGAALYPQEGTVNDGKIVMAGRAFVAGKHKFSGQFEFGLVRFNTDGTLDTTFGNGGKVTTSFPTGSLATGVVVLSDGKIVAAGNELPGNVFELARYNANGTLDTTFGSGGEVVTPLAQFPSLEVGDLLQQADGKLIVVGDTNGGAPNDWVLARYNANGSLDTSFGNQGVVVTPLSGLVGSGAGGNGSAALYPNAGTPNDGKILVVGSDSATGTWQMVRYNANGTLDTNFGSGGEVVTPIGGSPFSVALDASGRPVITGDKVVGSGPLDVTELARFNLDGTPDTTFGSGGLVTMSVSSSSQGRGVAIYPNAGTANDGKIVVVGDSAENSNGTGYNFLVARFLPSEPQIGSFTANPNPVTAASSVTLTASNLTDGNPNSSITQVAFYLDSNNDGKLEPGTDTLLGYATQTSPGVWTLTDSSAFGLTAGTYTLFAQAQDNDGVVGDPDALTLTVQ
jgi:uncharacterized delta-60 repeat protein